MMANLDDARDVLAGALELTSDKVPDGARLGEPEAWDSLAHLRLILAIEARLGRELNPDQVFGIESLEDIAALLDA